MAVAPIQYGYLGGKLQVYLGNGGWRNPTPTESANISRTPTAYAQVDRSGRVMTPAQVTANQQLMNTQAAQAQQMSTMTQQQQMALVQQRQAAEAAATQARLAAQAQAQQQAAAQARAQAAAQAAVARPIVQQPAVQLPPSFTQPVAPQQAIPATPASSTTPARPAVPPNQQVYIYGQPVAGVTYGAPTTPTPASTAPTVDPAWEAAFAKWKANNAAWQAKFLANQQTSQQAPVGIAALAPTASTSIASPNFSLNPTGPTP